MAHPVILQDAKESDFSHPWLAPQSLHGLEAAEVQPVESVQAWARDYCTLLAAYDRAIEIGATAIEQRILAIVDAAVKNIRS